MAQPVVASSPVMPVVDSETPRWQLWLAGAAFLSLWLVIVRQVSPEWSLNPQYGYGWSVPFLALFLIARKWPDRPASVASSGKAIATLIVVAASLVVFPARFVAEANPDWRLLSWALALSGVAISLAAVFLCGGWPWLRFFSFPFLFFLVAVPWPAQFEQFVIQNLMRAVTGINVSALNLIGVPALQHGNVIEVTTGLIGVEEACSGVRSIQATLMISLFLGELYSFTFMRRILLIITGGALAFFCNLVRTAILVGIGVRRGPAAIESWHDPAGLTILLVCLFGLWAISLLMRRFLTTEQEQEISPVSARSSPIRFPFTVLAVVGLWLLLAEMFVQFWYNTHESPANKVRWSVRWPTTSASYTTIAIPPQAQELLHYNDGGGGSWNDPEDRQWIMYFFRWLPGRTAARFVKIHRPDICLPASGLTMVGDHGMRFLPVGKFTLPVRSYRFDDHGTPLHVYYCYWDARSSYGSADQASAEDWTARGRVKAALRGQREIGAQMLELVVRGYDDDREAAAALERQLGQVIGAG